MAERQEDAALAHVFGTQPGVDQRVGIERKADRGLLGVAEAGVLQTIYFQLSLFVRVPPRPGRRRRPPRAAPGP